MSAMLRALAILLGTSIVACGGVAPMPATATRAPLPPSWSVAYRRHCEGPRTPPVIARAGDFAFCNARFDLERGRFLGLVDPPLGDEGAAASLEGATVIARDRRGERAVIATARGVRVVALPSGEDIADVESSGEVRALALSDDGARVAVAGPRTVVIFCALPYVKSFRREHEVTLVASSLVFSPDGNTLLVGHGPEMTALQRGRETIRPPSPMPYEPRMPTTFEAAERRAGEASDAFAFGADARSEPGLVGWYRKRDHFVDVVVWSYEASELGHVTDDETWARLVALRFGMTEAIGASGWRVWKDDKQRSVTMVRRVREVCDPHDEWVRFTERGGSLHRVRLETAPGTPARGIAPLARVFLIEPFGDPEAMKLPFRLPRLPWLLGSC